MLPLSQSYGLLMSFLSRVGLLRRICTENREDQTNKKNSWVMCSSHQVNLMCASYVSESPYFLIAPKVAWGDEANASQYTLHLQHAFYNWTNQLYKYKLHYTIKNMTHLIDREVRAWWLWSCPLFLCASEENLSKVTGKFRTSCPHTSQFLFFLMLNHLIAQSSCINWRAPLQLHSILRVFPSSQASKQILQIASSSGISSSLSQLGEPGVIWSEHKDKLLMLEYINNEINKN